jgi:hypothetical protein
MATFKLVRELPGRDLISEGTHLSHRVEALMSLYGRMLAAYEEYAQTNEITN